MLILTGCPVFTTNSIDNGSYDVPGYLAGKWYQVDKQGGNVDKYVIRPQSKKQKGLFHWNRILYKNQDTSLDQTAIMSEIDGMVFANFKSYENKPDDTAAVGNSADDTVAISYGYYIYEFKKVSDKEFTLTGIKSDLIKKDASSSEILDFLKKNKNDPDIFDSNEFFRFKKM